MQYFFKYAFSYIPLKNFNLHNRMPKIFSLKCCLQLYISLYTMIKLSKTSFPQKLFPSDCITLYINFTGVDREVREPEWVLCESAGWVHLKTVEKRLLRLNQVIQVNVTQVSAQVQVRRLSQRSVVFRKWFLKSVLRIRIRSIAASWILEANNQQKSWTIHTMFCSIIFFKKKKL